MSYFIIHGQSGNVLAGPFPRYVDAFNARAPFGAIGRIVERSKQEGAAANPKITYGEIDQTGGAFQLARAARAKKGSSALPG